MKDVSQSIKDKPKKRCPKCKKHKLERVIYGGAGAFVQNTNTIGKLADRNWKQMSHYKKSEIEEKNKQNAKASEPDFGKHASATRKEINKMTEKQKQNYIMRGDK
tara:strand:- start:461 stop:775 length:315 start_codon:yes stop_codon:yes gene_type:complete